MQTTALTRKLQFACAALASILGVNVAQAQLTVHLVADAGSVTSGGDGTEATAWNDTGSANADLTATGGTAPTWHSGQIGSSASSGYLTFDKNQSDVMSALGITGGSIFNASSSAIFLVVRAASGNAAGGIYGWSETTHYFLAAENDASPTEHNLALAHEGLFQAPKPGGFENNWVVVSLVRNGNAADIRVNGTSVGNDANAFSSSLPTGTQGEVNVGKTPNASGQHWSGDIAEIRVYNDPNAINISQIEQDLTAAYLTPVPEPSQYAMVFGLACVGGALVYRRRRQNALAS